MADTNVNGGTQQATGKLKSVESLDQTNEMERGLSNRHVQFIAIGGTIGTGLFLGSGKSISLTGPSIIFVYILVGVIMFFLMRAIGEMMYRDPSQHTFINFITRYLGNGWGHFAGWTYWAALVLLGKVFGEVEFWFSMIKITLICAMIATAVVMIVIGYHYPAVQIHGVDHVSPAGHAGFDNLFANFSFAPNGWMAFLMSFQMVFFAYEMIEFVGVTVSETKNPRKVLPKAINEIIVRVLIFYVGALVAIMCIVPWTSFKPNEDGLFIYILTLLAHRRYRRSADFIPDGFVMPAWKVLNTVAIVFFVFIYLTLFLADDTRNSAIAGLVWLVGFGGFSMLRERYRSRDLKAALEHKE